MIIVDLPVAVTTFNKVFDLAGNDRVDSKFIAIWDTDRLASGEYYTSFFTNFSFDNDDAFGSKDPSTVIESSTVKITVATDKTYK